MHHMRNRAEGAYHIFSFICLFGMNIKYRIDAIKKLTLTHFPIVIELKKRKWQKQNEK